MGIIKTSHEIFLVLSKGTMDRSFASKKWIAVDDLFKEMQEIVDKEKGRCGEANAVTCWTILKKRLKEESTTHTKI